MANCRDCDAPLLWGTTRDEKKMPLDAEPSPKGTWVVESNGLARKATDEDRRLMRPLFVPHWAQCPAAAQFRKPR